MLTIQGLGKTFNKGGVNERVALNNISLTLNEGDFVTVIGGNGAGKSTLLNAIAGVFPIDNGSIVIDGTDVTRLPEHKRAKLLGRVFQDPMMGTASRMGIDENLALAMRRGGRRGLRWGVPVKERESYRATLGVLGLGLEARLTAKVGTLSGGQRQALTLIMATIKKPRLLLLDEHTAALDPHTAEKVMIATDKIVRDNKLITIMVTHNMKQALAYGNRLIMMDKGNVILDIPEGEKQRLSVEDLMEKFAQASGERLANDRVLLA
jgi:putative ABC transport system ATP-binding protein